MIERDEQRIAGQLQRYSDQLAGKRVLIMSNGIKAWSVARMLWDAGMQIVGTGGFCSERCRPAQRHGEGWQRYTDDRRMAAARVSVALIRTWDGAARRG
jgi:nitrogenase molybdenum-iron protein alpha/beta subunit